MGSCLLPYFIIILLTVVDPNPIDIEINLSIEISNDRAVLTWSIESERDSLSRLTITISRIESFMLNNVQFFDVATYNVTEIGLTEKCFSSLNSSETYQFCIQPHSNDGINLPETCQFGTTSNSDRGLTSDSGCVPVVPERLSGGSGEFYNDNSLYSFHNTMIIIQHCFDKSIIMQLIYLFFLVHLDSLTYLT